MKPPVKIRIVASETLKEQFRETCDDMGINVSSLVALFVKQVVNYGYIPIENLNSFEPEDCTQGDTFLYTRLDADLKKDFDAICKKFGKSTTSVFNCFARTVVERKRIPFEIRATHEKE